MSMMMPATVRTAIEEAFDPRRFFVATPRRLRVEHVASERLPWEVFRGHLLDPAHARETAEFEAWNLFLDDDREPSSDPLISIKWQSARQQLFVVRQIFSHGFEAYEDLPGVILSRPVQKWVAELAGTIEIEQFDSGRLRGELAGCVFRAVIGSSRLPITSVESPLPAFSLGQLAYFSNRSGSCEAQSDPIAFLRLALIRDCKPIERAKALEAALRAIDVREVPRLADALETSIGNDSAAPDRIVKMVREVFNTVALSPYTGFVDTLIATLAELALPRRLGAVPIVDLVSYMLRHLCRHLTAFDLTLFHNFGANYPDALFLDSLLKVYLQFVDAQPELFINRQGDLAAWTHDKRRRRRALRQACLIRKQYEGHRVPDAPTSMGENVRVLPAPFARVPEEQILPGATRRRILFEGDPLDSAFSEPSRQRVLQESLTDLTQAAELGELGMAHFLDRPLGVFKQPGEVDRTPLLSYEAFSPSVVKRRLAQLKSAGWITQQQREAYAVTLDQFPARGVPVASLAPLERAGVASLADAQKVATDFVLLRTTGQSRREFLAEYDVRELELKSRGIADSLQAVELIVLARNPRPDGSLGRPTLRGYSRQGRPRMELGFALAPVKTSPYRERGGVELVLELQIVRLWSVATSEPREEFDLHDKAMWLKLRK